MDYRGTFLVITVTNDLILGIAAGFGFAIINFIICYASVSHVEESNKKSSNVVRDYASRRTITTWNRREIAVISLHGFLFFGSSMQIIRKAKDLVYGPSTSLLKGQSFVGKIVSWLQKKLTFRRASGDHTPLLNGQTDVNYSTAAGVELDEEEGFGEHSFLVLDFSRVTGMDATAVSTGLMRVKQMSQVQELRMVLTSLRPEFEAILRANDVISDDRSDPSRVRVFANLNDGLSWVEKKILKFRGVDLEYTPLPSTDLPSLPFAFNPDNSPNKLVASIANVPSAVHSLREIFQFYYSLWDTEITPALDLFGIMRAQKGAIIFDIGQASGAFYIVLDGEVALVDPTSTKRARECFNGPQEYSEEKLKEFAISQRCTHGSVFGEVHFYLQEERAFAAVATTETFLFLMTQSSWKELVDRFPNAALSLSNVMIRSLSLQVSVMHDRY